MSKIIVVDIETDGGIQGINSMVCFGAVLLDKELTETFYAQTAPISDKFVPEALAISGFSREQHEKFEDPKIAMEDFQQWIKDVCGNERPILVADNNQFDGSWINYYFLRYIGENPFGYSSRRIGDLFCGFYNDPYFKWKKFRKTSHDHNPVNDAKGNAEALLHLVKQGFKLKM